MRGGVGVGGKLPKSRHSNQTSNTWYPPYVIRTYMLAVIKHYVHRQSAEHIQYIHTSMHSIYLYIFTSLYILSSKMKGTTPSPPGPKKNLIRWCTPLMPRGWKTRCSAPRKKEERRVKAGTATERASACCSTESCLTFRTRGSRGRT